MSLTFQGRGGLQFLIIEQIAVKDLNCKKGRREYLGATCVFLALFFWVGGGREGGKGSRGKSNLVKIN